ARKMGGFRGARPPDVKEPFQQTTKTSGGCAPRTPLAQQVRDRLGLQVEDDRVAHRLHAVRREGEDGRAQERALDLEAARDVAVEADAEAGDAPALGVEDDVPHLAKLDAFLVHHVAPPDLVRAEAAHGGSCPASGFSSCGAAIGWAFEGGAAWAGAMSEQVLARRIVEGILSGALDRAAVQNAKIRLASELGVARLPSNADILAAATPEERRVVEPALRIRPTRSISGVTIVTVQSSPEACPHGKCTYCPGGPDFGTAQSYTGDEPAARRSARHGFDPHGQTAGRLADLHKTGHPTDKVDFIVQGGTFTARDESYQRWFVQRALDAMNGRESASLAEAQALNESAPSRMIGLTIETKPDWALSPHVDLSLELGCTRYELGVQTVFDDVLRLTHRGHTMKETVEAFQVVKDAGLKLCAHVMPGQPGSSRERDLATLRAMFADPRFAPDMLKIYP